MNASLGRSRSRRCCERVGKQGRTRQQPVWPVLLLTCCAVALSAQAQTNALNYQVSWLGNTFSGASNRWVQN